MKRQPVRRGDVKRKPRKGARADAAHLPLAFRPRPIVRRVKVVAFL